jgi:hypothetical protein
MALHQNPHMAQRAWRKADSQLETSLPHGENRRSDAQNQKHQSIRESAHQP